MLPVRQNYWFSGAIGEFAFLDNSHHCSKKLDPGSQTQTTRMRSKTLRSTSRVRTRILKAAHAKPPSHRSLGRRHLGSSRYKTDTELLWSTESRARVKERPGVGRPVQVSKRLRHQHPKFLHTRNAVNCQRVNDRGLCVSWPRKADFLEVVGGHGAAAVRVRRCSTAPHTASKGQQSLGERLEPQQTDGSAAASGVLLQWRVACAC